MRAATLQPYDNHFHPVRSADSQSSKPDSRRVGHPLAAVNVVPHAEQVIAQGMLEKWDYVLRRLFVLKVTPLRKAIGSLALGAESLLKPLTDPSLPEEQRVDVDMPIRDLTINDWALIVRAFDNWPFAPEVCRRILLVRSVTDCYFRRAWSSRTRSTRRMSTGGSSTSTHMLRSDVL